MSRSVTVREKLTEMMISAVPFGLAKVHARLRRLRRDVAHDYSFSSLAVIENNEHLIEFVRRDSSWWQTSPIR